jgi:hypothetical protein
VRFAAVEAGGNGGALTELHTVQRLSRAHASSSLPPVGVRKTLSRHCEDMGCSAQGVQLPALLIHRPCISNDACVVQLAARERHLAAPALRKKAAIGAWLP